MFPLLAAPLEISSNAPSSTRQRPIGVTTQITNALWLLYLVPQLLGWQEPSPVVNAHAWFPSFFFTPTLKFCSFPLCAHSCHTWPKSEVIGSRRIDTLKTPDQYTPRGDAPVPYLARHLPTLVLVIDLTIFSSETHGTKKRRKARSNAQRVMSKRSPLWP
jgi:hypothetical protein